MTKYELKGLSIMQGERLVCLAVADLTRYDDQAAEMQLIVDLLNEASHD